MVVPVPCALPCHGEGACPAPAAAAGVSHIVTLRTPVRDSSTRPLTDLGCWYTVFIHKETLQIPCALTMQTTPRHLSHCRAATNNTALRTPNQLDQLRTMNATALHCTPPAAAALAGDSELRQVRHENVEGHVVRENNLARGATHVGRRVRGAGVELGEQEAALASPVHRVVVRVHDARHGEPRLLDACHLLLRLLQQLCKVRVLGVVLPPVAQPRRSVYVTVYVSLPHRL